MFTCLELSCSSSHLSQFKYCLNLKLKGGNLGLSPFCLPPTIVLQSTSLVGHYFNSLVICAKQMFFPGIYSCQNLVNRNSDSNNISLEYTVGILPKDSQPKTINKFQHQHISIHFSTSNQHSHLIMIPSVYHQSVT